LRHRLKLGLYWLLLELFGDKRVRRRGIIEFHIHDAGRRLAGKAIGSFVLPMSLLGNTHANSSVAITQKERNKRERSKREKVGWAQKGRPKVVRHIERKR